MQRVAFDEVQAKVFGEPFPDCRLSGPGDSHDDHDRRNGIAMHFALRPSAPRRYVGRALGGVRLKASPHSPPSRVPRKTVGPLGAGWGDPPAGSSVTISSPAPLNRRAFSGVTAIRLRPDE